MARPDRDSLGLGPLAWLRTAFRRLARLAARVASAVLLRVTVRGREHVPIRGGVVLAMNHLGGADPIIALAFTPRDLDIIGKHEILAWPILGTLARAYGMIAVRRGEADRTILRAALDVLREGGALLIAPEGRESPTRALQEAKGGVAFLALQGPFPIVPIAITGTEWPRVLHAWRRLRRPCVTLTFGRPLLPSSSAGRQEVADEIMRAIAILLPPEYQGSYPVDPVMPEGAADA